MAGNTSPQHRGLRWSGLGVLLWFTGCVVGFAALRPDYHHATKAISELGAVGAPNMLWMNFLGFIGAAVLLALFALQARKLPTEIGLDYRLLLACAALFAMNAVPIQMGSDGDPDMHAVTSRIHFMFAMLTPLPWLIALSKLIRVANYFRRRDLTILSGICLVGFSIFALAGIFRMIPGMPGLLQRLSFLFFLFWFALAGWLLSQSTPDTHA